MGRRRVRGSGRCRSRWRCGRSIGSVADRPNEELLGLIAGDRAAAGTAGPPPPTAAGGGIESLERADELRRLGRLLPEGARLLVGGHAARGYLESLEAAGARVLDDVPAFRRELELLRAG